MESDGEVQDAFLDLRNLYELQTRFSPPRYVETTA